MAQIFKRKDENGQFYGGPAYYIEERLNKPKIAALFCIFLIATYAVGFNLLCSYNLQSTFMDYSFIIALIVILINYSNIPAMLP